VGAFAPDFEYFLRLYPNGRYGHTFPGVLALTFPLALVVLWLFHSFVKVPVVNLLPNAVQLRLSNHLHEFRFGGTARFTLIVSSVWLGIVTHLAWDLFTHPNTWIYRLCPILGQQFQIPLIGLIPFYKILQHASTIVGIAILSIWLVRRYRATEPFSGNLCNPGSTTQKIPVVAALTTVALTGAIFRAVAVVGIPSDPTSVRRFTGVLVVAGLAFAWWQLVAYGVFLSRKRHLPTNC
jgi:hypothetical protein